MRTILILLAGMLVLLAALNINESTSGPTADNDQPTPQVEMAGK